MFLQRWIEPADATTYDAALDGIARLTNNRSYSMSPNLHLPPTHASSGANPKGTGKVLLVEDDLVAGMAYLRTLAADGRYDVAHVQTAEAAIEYLSRYSVVECVISDVTLPGLDGFEVLRASKILRPNTPVLLLTSDADPNYPGLAIREGADDLMIAPVDPQELVLRVAALIQKGRRVRTTAAHTVLAIGAHPDDVEIGIAGTLLRHLAENDQVIQLVMTDGEAGGHREQRVAEAERAARQLGVTLVRGELRDAFLADDRSTVGVIERVVADFMPSVVYVHSIHDDHQDHRATFNAALSATRGVTSVYSYQSPSCNVGFSPARFVDIGDYLETKIDIIGIYRSQTATRVYLAEDLIRATARYWGRHAGHRLVEPLEVLRQLDV